MVMGRPFNPTLDEGPSGEESHKRAVVQKRARRRLAVPLTATLAMSKELLARLSPDVTDPETRLQ